ncbi:MAG: metallophosphoesterase [Armatimonadota bacterium]|nr:metallophosphoesterase [Armatimonadota bacterium]
MFPPGSRRGALHAQTPAVLVGAGDIASCQSPGDEATARLLDAIDGTVFTTGDNVYERGTDDEFANCYHPSWGRHRARTRPSVGNHEYYTPGAAGYFRYFGAAAGEPGLGYYSYDLGSWHVIVLNSNCRLIGCGPDSPQMQWLRRDLDRSRAACTVAYWHHPRFSSGLHGSDPALQAMWQVLASAGVDVALTGHDHLYERFAPMDAQGRLDPHRGVRQFVIGTGGRSHYPFRTLAAHSEVRQSGTFGVLRLELEAAGYAWEFIPEAGKSFRDIGTARCSQ